MHLHTGIACCLATETEYSKNLLQKLRTALHYHTSGRLYVTELFMISYHCCFMSIHSFCVLALFESGLLELIENQGTLWMGRHSITGPECSG